MRDVRRFPVHGKDLVVFVVVEIRDSFHNHVRRAEPAVAGRTNEAPCGLRANEVGQALFLVGAVLSGIQQNLGLVAGIGRERFGAWAGGRGSHG